MAGSPPQPMSTTSSPRQPISTPLASLAPSKQSTPVATPTKGMFTFPTMSGPPPSANSAMTQKPTVPITPDLESGSRILGKRKIQELVGQIDPSERLEPEVEDVNVLFFHILYNLYIRCRMRMDEKGKSINIYFVNYRSYWQLLMNLLSQLQSLLVD